MSSCEEAAEELVYRIGGAEVDGLNLIAEGIEECMVVGHVCPFDNLRTIRLILWFGSTEA